MISPDATRDETKLNIGRLIRVGSAPGFSEIVAPVHHRVTGHDFRRQANRSAPLCVSFTTCRFREFPTSPNYGR
jgi:hypothetical protein